MADGTYDNTNSGVFFKPYDDQKLFGQGKLNIEGEGKRIVVVMERLSRDKDPLPVVYERLGPLFPNDKKGNDKAPDRSGPMDNYPNLRMAVWKGEKDGRKYFSVKVSMKDGGQSAGGNEGSGNSEPAPSTGGWDDEIPF